MNVSESRISLTNTFIISHLIIEILDSLTFILHTSQILFICFYFITLIIQKFTVNKKAPKYLSRNKEKKKEEPRNKIPSVSRGG